MAKYIGTYTNETAIQTALNNNELNRPFVALANDTKQVYYGNIIDLAQIGDIVVYDTARTSLRFIHLADYNTTTYPTATYEPIGVVCENQTSTLAGGASDVKMVSIKALDMTNPDSGVIVTSENYRQVSHPIWGDTSVATNAKSTTDGKANTTLVLTFATGQSDWHTASTITYTDGQRMYPLFECAWRYHTNGTSQGDWYIGTRNEFGVIASNSTLIKTAYHTFGVYVDTIWGDGTWTSEEAGTSSAYRFDFPGSYIWDKNGGYIVFPLWNGTVLPM